MTGILDSEVPQREIEEVIALYALEPDILDLYVEGRVDRVFLEHLLEGLGAEVIEIDCVNVPADTVEKLGLQPGNRAEVITLAVELERSLPQDVEYRQRCIVDADLDRVIDAPSWSSRFLRFTDFSCLESYWFDDYHLSKYRKLGLHDVGQLATRDLPRELAPVLRKLFALRAARACLGESWEWIDFLPNCKLESGTIGFDENRFIDRWLHKNAAHGRKEALIAKRDELLAIFPEDPRNTIHGHDFIELLAWYVRKHIRDNKLTYVEVVARSLACCSDATTMGMHPLPQELTRLALNQSPNNERRIPSQGRGSGRVAEHS